MKSLESNTIDYEVVFCGPSTTNEEFKNFKCIQTNVKPAQCYEIARRACTGELVHWTADDAEYEPGCLDIVYKYWQSLNNPKAVISLLTKENGSINVMETHRFFAGFNDSPLMAPLGFMNREYLESIGGLDRNFIGGQYENDIVCRVVNDGGKVYICKDSYVSLDHQSKHQPCNPFACEHHLNRQFLEQSYDHQTWQRVRPVESFEDKDILVKSQGPKAQWE